MKSFQQLLKEALIRIDKRQDKKNEKFRDDMRKMFNDPNMFKTTNR